jgi:hypothetical protein
MPDKKVFFFTNGYRNQFYYRYGRMFNNKDKALDYLKIPFLNGGLFECLDITLQMNARITLLILLKIKILFVPE